MVKKSYLYLGEQNIGIEGSSELLERVNRNFEEEPVEGVPTIGDVRIEEGRFVEFSRDRSKPYLITRANSSKGYQGVDFLRYGVLVKTLWKRDPLHYEVENFLPLDETGALKCFKKIYYSTDSSKDKVLIHGSLVDVGGKGVLVVGECWSGKTSLTLGFLEKLNGKLVSDGNILISYNDGRMVGHYLPRPVFVRFHSISTTRGLAKVLRNPQEAESIQPFDWEFIEEIMAEKRYESEAGLNISRKKFAELMGVGTIPFREIDTIIHTRFDDSELPEISPASIKESYGLFIEREFPKNTTIGNIQHQRDIESPDNSVIGQNWLEGMERIRVSFDAKKNLTQSLLEDLI